MHISSRYSALSISPDFFLSSTSEANDCSSISTVAVGAKKFRLRISLSARALNDGVLNVLRDRKSTRLNSSHSQISYAVFCLKKKKINEDASQIAQLISLLDLPTALSRLINHIPNHVSTAFTTP